MKEFRKTSAGLFICEECNRIFNKKEGLSLHIRITHMSQKEYYDKWLKEEGEGLCKICSKETIFTGFKKYYKNCCSDLCFNKYVQICIENSLLEKHGVKNNFQREECKEKSRKTKKERYEDENYVNSKKAKQTKKERYGNENYTNTEKSKQTKKEKYGDENYCNVEKSKQTKKEKYGDENYNNIEKAKQTCLKKFGVDHQWKVKEIFNKGKQTKKERYGNEKYNNREKNKQTCLKKFNVENCFQSLEIIEKGKQTKKEKYGYEYPLQNPYIFQKSQNKAFYSKLYKNTNIYYRGTYEEDFLNNYIEKYLDIINAPIIKYIFNNKKHIYHPDFYIPSLNLIIEIKNSYLMKRYKKSIEAKAVATIAAGYNYIIIIDKDYTEFNKLILDEKI